MTPIARPVVVSLLLLTVALSGCATCSLDDLRRATGITEQTRAPKAAKRKLRQAALPEPAAELKETKVETADKTEEGRRWCQQRFIDHQEGRRPGDARSVEQKRADDEFCAVLRQD